jgi:hypothetical protein
VRRNLNNSGAPSSFFREASGKRIVSIREVKRLRKYLQSIYGRTIIYGPQIRGLSTDFLLSVVSFSVGCFFSCRLFLFLDWRHPTGVLAQAFAGGLAQAFAGGLAQALAACFGRMLSALCFLLSAFCFLLSAFCFLSDAFAGRALSSSPSPILLCFSLASSVSGQSQRLLFPTPSIKKNQQSALGICL